MRTVISIYRQLMHYANFQTQSTEQIKQPLQAIVQNATPHHQIFPPIEILTPSSQSSSTPQAILTPAMDDVTLPSIQPPPERSNIQSPKQIQILKNECVSAPHQQATTTFDTSTATARTYYVDNRDGTYTMVTSDATYEENGSAFVQEKSADNNEDVVSMIVETLAMVKQIAHKQIEMSNRIDYISNRVDELFQVVGTGNGHLHIIHGTSTPSFQPIDNVEQLKEFEAKLAKASFVSELVIILQLLT